MTDVEQALAQGERPLRRPQLRHPRAARPNRQRQRRWQKSGRGSRRSSECRMTHLVAPVTQLRSPVRAGAAHLAPP